MKQENTEQSLKASGILSLMSDSTYHSIEGGPFVARIKKTQLRKTGEVTYTFPLEVRRQVLVGETVTTYPSFEFRPHDLLYLPWVARNLAEFFVDDGAIDGVLRWDLSNMASCLTDTFHFEEWEQDFFREEEP